MKIGVIAVICVLGVLTNGCTYSQLKTDASLKVPNAQYRYGLHLIHNDDVAEGKDYILMAVKAGDQDAIDFWDVYHNWVDTLILAYKGDLNAMREVGYNYSLDNSPISTVHDSELTLRWLSAAYSKGDHHSAFILGNLYSEGRVFDKDESEAFSWFMKSAKSGGADAQFELFNRYLVGNGTDKNLALAEYWLKAANFGGQVDAQKALINHFTHGEHRNYGWALHLLAKDNDFSQIYKLIPYLTKLKTVNSNAKVYRSFDTNEVIGTANSTDLYAIYFEGDWVEVYLTKKKLVGVMRKEDISIDKKGRDWALKGNYQLCKAKCTSSMCYQNNADGTKDEYSLDTVRASMCLTF